MSWLDAIINRYLSMDPEMSDKVAAFEGKVIAIDIQGLNKVLYMFPVGSRIIIKQHYDGEADTVLKGTPTALFRMGLSKDVAPMMLKGEIEITGDVRLGREFKKMLGQMDIDWEEHLARLLGDAGAYQMMNVVRRMTDWGLSAANSVSADVAEYLQEESRDVVSGEELEMFYQQVDKLRNDVDRLQARLNVIMKGVQQDIK